MHVRDRGERSRVTRHLLCNGTWREHWQGPPMEGQAPRKLSAPDLNNLLARPRAIYLDARHHPGRPRASSKCRRPRSFSRTRGSTVLVTRVCDLPFSSFPSYRTIFIFSRDILISFLFNGFRPSAVTVNQDVTSDLDGPNGDCPAVGMKPSQGTLRPCEVE